ncbi:unnamed protein product, partial [Rotaria magnacalcarata]
MNNQPQENASNGVASSIASEPTIVNRTSIFQKANESKFSVFCLSEKKTLNKKKYDSIDRLKADAFALYKDEQFDDDNAILTYFDENNSETLLTSVPKPQKNGQHKYIFIRFVHPWCAMCAKPFGIIDDQLLLECPRTSCSQQYCKKCVDTIRGPSPEHPFVCSSCKKNVIPERNPLIERYLLWKKFSKLYGVENIQNLNSNSKLATCQTVLNDINTRRLHLQQWVNTFQKKTENNQPIEDSDQQLISNAMELIVKVDEIGKELKDIKS